MGRRPFFSELQEVGKVMFFFSRISKACGISIKRLDKPIRLSLNHIRYSRGKVMFFFPESQRHAVSVLRG